MFKQRSRRLSPAYDQMSRQLVKDFYLSNGCNEARKNTETLLGVCSRRLCILMETQFRNDDFWYILDFLLDITFSFCLSTVTGDFYRRFSDETKQRFTFPSTTHRAT